MGKDSKEIKPLIEEIRSLTLSDKVKTGTLALFNLIPYAGGVIASVIGECASHRKREKICDVLSDLNARLEASKVDPRQHLSEDQIIELVHETLQTASVTSDKLKLDALKRGLGYAFTNEDTFECKQVFLQVLRTCTSLELVLLSAIYESTDPYIIREGQPAAEPAMGSYNRSFVSTIVSQGKWQPKENRNCDQPPLLKFLADRINSDEGATEGAARLLDGKGLTNCGPNLLRQDCIVLSWVPYSATTIFRSATATGTLTLTSSPEVQPSPLEASQTQFGQSFLRFCQHG
ncbi:MAG TPA: hypothetical protein VMW24_25165 [Sedimentisphaerales bacterium]|nr:hypothetical protein [Thermoguttaceae bacterium]HUV67204.1 hypothetical protein [Sedimentisphaerales bacterium]